MRGWRQSAERLELLGLLPYGLGLWPLCREIGQQVIRHDRAKDMPDNDNAIVSGGVQLAKQLKAAFAHVLASRDIVRRCAGIANDAPDIRHDELLGDETQDRGCDAQLPGRKSREPFQGRIAPKPE